MAKANGWSNEVNIFVGKAGITNLIEEPQSVAFGAIKASYGLEKKSDCDDKGLLKVWPDFNGSWSVVLMKKGSETAIKKYLAAGSTNFNAFTAKVFVGSEELATEIRSRMKGRNTLFLTEVICMEDIKSKAGGKGLVDGKLKGRGKGAGAGSTEGKGSGYPG